eukprot:jgi/Tetstr1/464049/TSEL_008854.t1
MSSSAAISAAAAAFASVAVSAVEAACPLGTYQLKMHLLYLHVDRVCEECRERGRVVDEAYNMIANCRVLLQKMPRVQVYARARLTSCVRKLKSVVEELDP